MANSIITKISLGALQSVLWRVIQVGDQWGVFDSKGRSVGNPAIVTGILGDALESLGLGSTYSTDSVEFLKETAVSDFPVERGSFASYNKVEAPATPTVKLALQGTESQRKSFLDAIDKACKSTDLYSVVTPEVTYKDYSIERYDYSRRAQHGATLLIVSLNLKEVRQVSAQFTTTQKINDPKNAGATPQADTGKVQPKVPDSSTLRKGIETFGKIF
jgi:hypothetical protein